jgi:hypothetical protein
MRRRAVKKKKEFALVFRTDNPGYTPEQLTDLRHRINQELTQSKIVQIIRVRSDESVELLPL